MATLHTSLILCFLVVGTSQAVVTETSGLPATQGSVPNPSTAVLSESSRKRTGNGDTSPSDVGTQVGTGDASPGDLGTQAVKGDASPSEVAIASQADAGTEGIGQNAGSGTTGGEKAGGGTEASTPEIQEHRAAKQPEQQSRGDIANADSKPKGSGTTSDNTVSGVTSDLDVKDSESAKRPDKLKSTETNVPAESETGKRVDKSKSTETNVPAEFETGTRVDKLKSTETNVPAESESGKRPDKLKSSDTKLPVETKSGTKSAVKLKSTDTNMPVESELGKGRDKLKSTETNMPVESESGKGTDKLNRKGQQTAEATVQSPSSHTPTGKVSVDGSAMRTTEESTVSQAASNAGQKSEVGKPRSESVGISGPSTPIQKPAGTEVSTIETVSPVKKHGVKSGKSAAKKSAQTSAATLQSDAERKRKETKASKSKLLTKLSKLSIRRLKKLILSKTIKNRLLRKTALLLYVKKANESGMKYHSVFGETRLEQLYMDRMKNVDVKKVLNMIYATTKIGDRMRKAALKVYLKSKLPPPPKDVKVEGTSDHVPLHPPEQPVRIEILQEQQPIRISPSTVTTGHTIPPKTKKHSSVQFPRSEVPSSLTVQAIDQPNGNHISPVVAPAPVCILQMPAPRSVDTEASKISPVIPKETAKPSSTSVGKSTTSTSENASTTTQQTAEPHPVVSDKRPQAANEVDKNTASVDTKAPKSSSGNRKQTNPIAKPSSSSVGKSTTSTSENDSTPTQQTAEPQPVVSDKRPQAADEVDKQTASVDTKAPKSSPVISKETNPTAKASLTSAVKTTTSTSENDSTPTQQTSEPQPVVTDKRPQAADEVDKNTTNEKNSGMSGNIPSSNLEVHQETKVSMVTAKTVPTQNLKPKKEGDSQVISKEQSPPSAAASKIAKLDTVPDMDEPHKAAAFTKESKIVSFNGKEGVNALQQRQSAGGSSVVLSESELAAVVASFF